jgi:predicted AAA+ superfamily ATPase
MRGSVPKRKTKVNNKDKKIAENGLHSRPFSAKMDAMIKRFLEKRVRSIIDNNLSIMLLGPRQTGKTTFIKELFKEVDYIEYNFMKSRERRRLERDPSLIIDEIEGTDNTFIFIDEVQKVPEVLDNIQVLADQGTWVFAITGSSARKLRRKGVNLLPGRTVTFHMDALFLEEYRDRLTAGGSKEELKQLLKFGELPRVFTLVMENKKDIAEELLYSYVNTYLEEEIRAESLVRNVGAFSRFLKLAAEESGRLISFRNLSQDVGIPRAAISEYYQILVDCLIAEKIEALVPASQRGKVVKSAKYLFFDTGVVNAAAEVLGSGEFRSEYWGSLFEQWVGLAILKYIRINRLKANLYYWRDYNSREVDWVIEYRGKWLPIEVKWTDRLKSSTARHIHYFLEQFPDKAQEGFVVFTGSRPTRLSGQVKAIPFMDLVDRALNPFINAK